MTIDSDIPDAVPEPNDSFSDDRFEQTRQKILWHLGEALEACAQPREFQVLIGPIVRLQEDTLSVAPGVAAGSLRAIIKFQVWRPVLRKVDSLSWIMFGILLPFGFVLLVEAIKRFIQSVGKVGSLNIIGSAYAATGPVDPTALLIFQLVIAAMVPILGIGGFCALIFANSPEGRKGGKELLIGVTGFVLGAATRMIS
jgi:hypothetical protein